MEPLVDVVIEDDRWDALTPLQPLADRAALAVLAELGLAPVGFTLCVLGCDDARILDLNGDFRGKAKATNVLSWPSMERGAAQAGTAPDLPRPGPADDPEHLGDIALSYDTCAAESQGRSFDDHVTHLIIHGILHLLGYDHIRDADGDVMEALETRIMARLGLPDPYAEVLE